MWYAHSLAVGTKGKGRGGYLYMVNTYVRAYMAKYVEKRIKRMTTFILIAIGPICFG